MPRKYVKRPPRELLSLPVADWPETDRVLFDRAFGARRDIFDEMGDNGTHLRPRTIGSISFAWRRWLGWIARTRPNLLTLPVTDRLTPEPVKDFIVHLRETNDRTAAQMMMRFLYDAARYMLPERDWAWLRTLTSRLNPGFKVKPKGPIAVTSDRLVDIGMAMMDEAEAMIAAIPHLNHSELRVFSGLHRDGLIICLEAFLPLRRTSLATMRLGLSLRREGEVWLVDIEPENVKNSQRIRATLPHWISERLDRHLEVFRPLFRGATSHDSPWASEKGGPLQGGSLYLAFKKRLRERAGLSLTLHDARRIGTTTWAIEDPLTVGGAKDLLGDKDAGVVAKHYNRAGSIYAARKMAQLIQKIRGTGESNKTPS